jgi:hypothetical protein
LLEFLNGLHADHLVLELAHRPDDDLEALKSIPPDIARGIGIRIPDKRGSSGDYACERDFPVESVLDTGSVQGNLSPR